jgi:hypothetical protein
MNLNPLATGRKPGLGVVLCRGGWRLLSRVTAVVVACAGVTASELLTRTSELLSRNENTSEQLEQCEVGPLVLVIWRRRRGVNPSTRAFRDTARFLECQIR